MFGRNSIIIAAAAVAISAGAAARGQLCSPRPLHELNLTTTPISSAPVALGTFNGLAVFSASTLETGRELWASDGTAAGTRLLLDAAAGTASSALKGMAVTSRGVYVRIGPGSSSTSELWITDGTVAGTRRLIALTNAAAMPGAIISVADRGDGGVAALVSRDGGTELWCSDGTPAGTVLLRTFDCCAPDESHDHFERLDGRLFFAAGDVANGKEIWSTDAQAQGVTRSEGNLTPDPAGYTPRWMKAINGRIYFAGTISGRTEPHMLTPGVGIAPANPSVDLTSSPYLFSAVGGGAGGAPARVVFWANDPTLGTELWSTSGVAGDAAMVVDLVPGAGWCAPDQAYTGMTASVGDRIVYAGLTAANGHELFVTDGTAAGTRLLRELVPGASDGVSAITPITPNLTVVDGIASDAEPVLTDGTDEGTIPIATLIPGPVTGARRSAGIADGRLYIATANAMYRTDGTPAGTELLAQLAGGATWSGVGQVQDLGSRVLLVATEGSGATVQSGRGQELWVIDVGAHTAAMLIDLHPSDNSTQPINAFAPLTGRSAGSAGFNPALFIARPTGSTSLSTLWAAGTDASRRVALLNFGPPNLNLFPSGVLRAFPFGAGSVVAIGVSPGSGSILYVRTDGTFGGTWPIIAIPQQASAVGPFGFQVTEARAGSVVVMSGFSQTSGQELWMTPGSPDSGGQLVDIWPGFGSSNPTGLTSLGDLVVFFATQPATGYEPWVTDGTVAGTFKLREIAPGSQSSVPVDFQAIQPSPAVLNGRVYFGATDGGGAGAPNNRVWTSDGTTLGTTPLVLPSITFTTPPRRFVATGSLVFFEGTSAATGTELYVTDGTPAGTRLLADATPGGSTVGLRELAAGRDRVFFVPQVGPQGAELWTSDGTVAGTVITRDIVPGGGGSTPQNLTVVGNTCFFTLLNPTGIPQGLELWSSDGTAAGTCIAADINPIGSSNPLYLRAVGSRLYFNASSPLHGIEPWVLETCAADFDNSGLLSVQDIFDYLGAWFAGSLSADFDSSGVLSVQDIFDYLGAWFTGCQ